MFYKFHFLIQVFPKGSPLANDVSEAVLEVTESGQVEHLEHAMLSSFNCSNSINLGSDSIGLGPFYSLFTISGAIAAFAVLITILRMADKHLKKSSCVQALFLNKRFWSWAYTFLSQSAQRYKVSFHR